MRAKSIFIITGMPRSRTAWLANYFTCGNTFCDHDTTSRFADVAGVAAYIRQLANEYDAVGISDSAAVYFQRQLAELLPEAVWVVIRRSVADCEKSFGKEHGIKIDLWDHYRKIGDVITERSPLVVDFDEIDSKLSLIAAKCCGEDWGLNPRTFYRDKMLQRFDVRLTDSALKSGIAAVKKSILDQAEPVVVSPARARMEALICESIGSNPHALEFWNQLVELADVYDHVIDGDGRDVAKTHRAFKSVALSWPLNPFLHDYRAVLVPVMSAAISAWRSGVRDKAFDIYTETANAIIYLVHGEDGVERWMPEIRKCVEILAKEDARKDGD